MSGSGRVTDPSTNPGERPSAVIVTGAASGIGRAAALRLAKDGYAIACLDIDEAGAERTACEVRSTGRPGLGLHLDVSSEGDVTSAFTDIGAQLGPVHALVHAAGILHVEPAIEVSPETGAT